MALTAACTSAFPWPKWRPGGCFLFLAASFRPPPPPALQFPLHHPCWCIHSERRAENVECSYAFLKPNQRPWQSSSANASCIAGGVAGVAGTWCLSLSCGTRNRPKENYLSPPHSPHRPPGHFPAILQLGMTSKALLTSTRPKSFSTMHAISSVPRKSHQFVALLLVFCCSLTFEALEKINKL